jgi:hypothetical protein
VMREGASNGSDAAKGSLALAGVLTVAAVVLTVTGEVLFLLNRPSAPPVVFGSRDSTAVAAAVFVSLPIIGLLVRRKQPVNPLWWIFSLVGLSYAVWIFADGYAVRGVWTAPGSLPAAEYAAWLANWIWVPGWALAAVLFLRFPDGYLLSPRWRAAVALVALQPVLLSAGLAFSPGPLRDYPYLANPFGIAGGGALFRGLEAAGWWLLGGFAVAVAASVVVRYRRSTGLRRQQLKWLAAAAAVIAVPIVIWIVAYPLGVRNDLAEKVSYLAPVMLPIAAGVAILRYRLYEIDRLISRTVSYAIITVVLTGLYTATVMTLGSVTRLATGQLEGDLVVAASTLTVAAAFRPVRWRVKQTVDQRFNRPHFDAQRTVQAFGHRLRDHLELATLSHELGSVATATMRPVSVSVWIPPEPATRPSPTAHSRRTRPVRAGARNAEP